MSFETEVTLGITVDSGELRAARRAIEDEMGDVSVGVDTSGAGERAMAGGGEGTFDSRRGRRMFRWARERTEYMADAVGILEDIENAGGLGVAGGQGGGGGGGGGILGNIFSYAVGRGVGAGGGGILSRILGFRGLSMAGAAGTALTMPGMLSGKVNTETGEGFGPIVTALNDWGMENSLNLADRFASLFDGEGSEQSMQQRQFQLLMGQGDNWPDGSETAMVAERPEWLDALRSSPAWYENAPPWLEQSLFERFGTSDPAGGGPGSERNITDIQQGRIDVPSGTGVTTSDPAGGGPGSDRNVRDIQQGQMQPAQNIDIQSSPTYDVSTTEGIEQAKKEIRREQEREREELERRIQRALGGRSVR